MTRRSRCNQNPHEYVHHGTNAGLRRNLCQRCGHVQIDLDDDQVVSTVSDRLRLALEQINEGAGLELDLRPTPLFGQAR